jgi:hypothetical protein
MDDKGTVIYKTQNYNTGRWSYSVLHSGFQLDISVFTYAVDDMYTQFGLPLKLHLHRMSWNVTTE